MIQPTLSSTLSVYPHADSQIIWSLAYVATSGGEQLVSMAYGGDIYTQFDLVSGDPSFDRLDKLTQSGSPIGLGAGIETFTLGATEYLVLTGFSGQDLPLYSIGPDGTLTDASALIGALGSTSRVTDLIGTSIDGFEYLLTADHISGTLTSYSAQNGAYAVVSTAPQLPWRDSPDLRDMAEVGLGSDTYFIAIDQAGDAVLAYQSNSAGVLVLTDEI